MRYVTAASLFKGQLFAENQSLLITPSMTHFCQLEVCPQSGNLHNILYWEGKFSSFDWLHFFNLYCHFVARRLPPWQVWGVMRRVTKPLEWTGVKCFIRGQNRMVRGETRILVSVTQGQEVALTPLPTHLDMNQWHISPKWKTKQNKKKRYSIPQTWMTSSFLHFWVNYPCNTLWLFLFWDQTLIIDLIYILNQQNLNLEVLFYTESWQKGFSP